MKLSSVVVLLVGASCDAFSVAPFLQEKASPRSQIPSLQATASEAIATLDASQTGTVNKIASSIPSLLRKPELSWTPQDGVMIAGCPATIDGREAPGADGNIAWLSSLCVQSKTSSLTIFNGPLTNVPHLLARCCVIDDSTMSFELDFRPRAYGAYEMRDAAGNYPGPEELGRASFEYSGNRMEYDRCFGTEEVSQFFQSTLASFEGASANPKPPSELDLLTRGPLAMDVTMPITDGNVAAIVVAKEKAADYWLGWALDTSFEHRPGAPVNSQYVYDTKYKQNVYESLLPIYSQLFGGDGPKLAAGDMGPLDEAYVGGGS